MQGYSFELESARRIADATRLVESWPVNVRPTPAAIRHPGVEAIGIPVYNNGANEIPAYGIMKISAYQGGGREAIQVDRPDAPFARLDSHLINGALTIAASGGIGWAQFGPVYKVLYDTGNTPAFAESWGPVASSFKATKRSAGYSVIGVTNSSSALMIVVPAPFLTGKGRLDADLNTASSAACSVYDENGDTTYNVTVYDSNPAMITSAKKIASGSDIVFAWLATHRQYHLVSADVCET